MYDIWRDGSFLKIRVVTDSGFLVADEVSFREGSAGVIDEVLSVGGLVKTRFGGHLGQSVDSDGESNERGDHPDDGDDLDRGLEP